MAEGYSRISDTGYRAGHVGSLSCRVEGWADLNFDIIPILVGSNHLSTCDRLSARNQGDVGSRLSHEISERAERDGGQTGGPGRDGTGGNRASGPEDWSHNSLSAS